MWDELTNALAWYKAAPARWIASAQQDLEAAAEWIWEVIQGDFAEEQSTAQVITGTVISMIPFVDQICDVRDVCANCKKINEDTSNKFAYVALALTLIGLFPTLGSLVKGGGKILFAYGRKAMFKAGAKALESNMWQASKPFVEAGIVKFNQFLARPEVRKTLAALKIDNPYKYFANKIRELASEVSVAKLLKAMDTAIEALDGLADLVKKWGNAALKTKMGQLLVMVKDVRDKANAKLAEVAKPLQDWLRRLARRLDIEADMNYRAICNARNPHAFVKVSEAAEADLLRADLPKWADNTKKVAHKAAENAPVRAGYPDLDPPVSTSGRKPPLYEAYKTFEEGTMEAVVIPPGETLYRIVDPTSKDNSICWMRQAEFEALKSKAEWRRRFAVWANWNSNGEFVTYTVPPGTGLRAWEGKAATQKHRFAPEIKLEGGGVQIVLDPATLEKSALGKRQRTSWPDGGYDGFGENVSLVGVPTLSSNWAEAQ